MQFSNVRLPIIVAASALMIAAASGSVAASDTTAAIQVERTWVRPSLGAVPNSAAYLLVTNTGDTADKLISATTDIAETVEIHEHIMDGTVMRMRRVEGGLEIPAGETVAFAPAGHHLMLIELTRKISTGEMVTLVLTFEHAGMISVEAVATMQAPALPGRGSQSGSDTSKRKTIHRGSSSLGEGATVTN